MKHLIIILSLLSTFAITGCGGGNMGGNTARDTQGVQQIEEPKMMADQGMNNAQPVLDENLGQNLDGNADQTANIEDNGENINNNDAVTNDETTDEKADENNDEIKDVDNDTDTKDTKDEDKDQLTDTTTSVEDVIGETTLTSTDNLVPATGTLVLANNTENDTRVEFDAFAMNLDPNAEMGKINRVASANTSGGENIPNLAELGK